MGFLKNLFGKKEEATEEVPAEELDSWFLENASDKVKEIEEELEETEDRIAEHRKSFEKAIISLRKKSVSLSPEENMDKEAYLKKAIDFLDEFHFIAEPEDEKLMQNFITLERAHREFLTGVDRHLEVIEDHFQDEIGDAVFATKGLADELGKLRDLLNEEGDLTSVKSLRKDVGLIKRANDMIEKISEDMRQKQFLLRKQLDFMGKLEKQLSGLAKGSEYQQISDQKNSLARLEKRLKDNEKAVQDRLLQLEKSAKIFPSLTNHNVVLLDFIKDPSKAVQDPTPLHQLIDSMKAVLNTELPSRQKDKAISALNELNRDFLESAHSVSAALRDKRKESSFNLRLNQDAREVEDAQYKINHAKSQARKIEAEIEKLEMQLERINLEKIKQHIGNKLTGFFERKIMVR